MLHCRIGENLNIAVSVVVHAHVPVQSMFALHHTEVTLASLGADLARHAEG